ncbi:carbohydrate kinase family protein [Acidisphaera sp. L21]|uniref:carbohydrate kinase family protein n=1 Tax=Acidisphaera sp. L21 TaxID=1641851 RepID=UPI001C20B4D0|nr:PfkB family carbohydrate kinase [Acidisphaera sp. L21]
MFVGVATQDAIALVDAYPRANDRVLAQMIRHAGGGPAATAAVACSRLGIPAAFVGAIARDALGDAILEGLRGEGVAIDAVLRVPGESGGSLVTVDRVNETRAICNRPGPALHIPMDSDAASLIRSADWVHVDQLGWAAVTALLADLPPEAGPKLSVDGGNHIPDFTPAGVALYAPTIERLQHLYGDGDPLALMQRARDAGAACVVATAGASGSYALDTMEHWAVPAYRADITSTLGAGDVFHGALLAAFAHGFPTGEALAYANIAAALSCRGLDGRSTIPSDGETRALLSRLTPVRAPLTRMTTTKDPSQ